MFDFKWLPKDVGEYVHGYNIGDASRFIIDIHHKYHELNEMGSSSESSSTKYAWAVASLAEPSIYHKSEPNEDLEKDKKNIHDAFLKFNNDVFPGLSINARKPERGLEDIMSILEEADEFKVWSFHYFANLENPMDALKNTIDLIGKGEASEEEIAENLGRVCQSIAMSVNFSFNNEVMMEGSRISRKKKNAWRDPDASVENDSSILQYWQEDEEENSTQRISRMNEALFLADKLRSTYVRLKDVETGLSIDR